MWGGSARRPRGGVPVVDGLGLVKVGVTRAALLEEADAHAVLYILDLDGRRELLAFLEEALRLRPPAVATGRPPAAARRKCERAFAQDLRAFAQDLGAIWASGRDLCARSARDFGPLVAISAHFCADFCADIVPTPRDP